MPCPNIKDKDLNQEPNTTKFEWIFILDMLSDFFISSSNNNKSVEKEVYICARPHWVY